MTTGALRWGACRGMKRSQYQFRANRLRAIQVFRPRPFGERQGRTSRANLLDLDGAMPDGKDQRCQTRLDAELVEDVDHVRPHGLGADVEVFADLAVGH